jgi:hypothetical protein
MVPLAGAAFAPQAVSVMLTIIKMLSRTKIDFFILFLLIVLKLRKRICFVKG